MTGLAASFYHVLYLVYPMAQHVESSQYFWSIVGLVDSGISIGSFLSVDSATLNSPDNSTINGNL